MKSPRLIKGDCLRELRKLPADSVQCVVTSPPYYGLRDYGVAGQIGLESSIDEYIERLVAVFREVRRVLKPDGTLWLNMGDGYSNGGRSSREADKKLPARGMSVRPELGLKPKDLIGMPWRVAFALQADGWYLRQDIIWHKANPMPESVKDRCTKAHEYLFLLTKSERYYFDQDAIKEPCSADTHARYARGRSENHKYADGGPGNQTIARSLEHMHKPSGWQRGKGSHDRIPNGRYHVPGNKTHKGTTAYEQGDEFQRTKGGLVKYAEKMRAAGVNPKAAMNARGSKQNASFAAACSANIVDRRNKRSVWTMANQPFKGAHFATFPEKLVEPCILAGSRPGDIVLDPFSGAGTTAVVAVKHDREPIGIELNTEYIVIASNRIAAAQNQRLAQIEVQK